MDIEKLREEIIEYLETEGAIFFESYIESFEIDDMSDDELIEKAHELGIL